MNEREILGKNIKRYRQVKGLMQQDLAKKVGLTKYTISNIELGKQENPGLKCLVSISQELDVCLKELFMEDANCIPLIIVASDRNIKTLKKMFVEFKRILADKGIDSFRIKIL